MRYEEYIGEENRHHLLDLAHLRLKVFSEFPYLYDGNLDYERKYLETYFKAKHSYVLLLRSEDQIIGATTGVWANEEEESFKKPFADYGIDPSKVFYFGESVILPEFRGRGYGKLFFEKREAYAKILPQIEWLAFCAVDRPLNHPLVPEGYKPLDSFWHSQGFHKEDELTTMYEWKDVNEEKATSKKMQFWLKNIKRISNV